MSHHIRESRKIITKKEPSKVFEDNLACITQLKEGYTKSNRAKSIPFFLYTRELEKNNEVDLKYICSFGNQADLFIKVFLTTKFWKHIYGLEMRHLHDLWKKNYVHHSRGKVMSLYYFSFVMVLIPSDFSLAQFLTKMYTIKNI